MELINTEGLLRDGATKRDYDYLTQSETKSFFYRYYNIMNLDENDSIVNKDKVLRKLIIDVKNEYRIHKESIESSKWKNTLGIMFANDIIVMIEAINRLNPNILQKYCSDNRKKKIRRKTK